MQRDHTVCVISSVWLGEGPLKRTSNTVPVLCGMLKYFHVVKHRQAEDRLYTIALYDRTGRVL